MQKEQVRIEHDTLGEVEVPKDRLWGAQTQRSYNNFKIGQPNERMPREIIRAFGYLKYACAEANLALQDQKMTVEKADAIKAAAKAVYAGELFDEFPLVVFQTGSGTQTNMNTNEVISGYAHMHLGVAVHPNDDVNMSQSSNDTFPTALHIAGVLAVDEVLIPKIEELIATLKGLEEKYAGVVKIGRTHLQDAVPIGFSQEISGWRASLEQDLKILKNSNEFMRELAIGGTAVGTGLNCPTGFDTFVCDKLGELTGSHFVPAKNKFHALTSLDEVVMMSGALKALAADMMKMANDVRWLASGPRAGIGEITIPANEPGSSIMPGKVNPTQCEQVTMVAAQVMGCDATIGFAATQGNFELNVFLPVVAYNLLQAIRLLADSCESFRVHCAVGIEANVKVMRDNLHNSLMLCTILSPVIGYEKAAQLAKYAYKHDCSLREANQVLQYLTDDEFDVYFKPEEMI